MHVNRGDLEKRVRRSQAGFTLVEVMVSTVLTSIAVIGLTALFRVESRASAYSRHATEATALAQDRMEYLRTQTTPTAATETSIDELGKTGGIFGRASTVNNTTDYIEYSVTVSWNEDGQGRTSTLRSRRGL